MRGLSVPADVDGSMSISDFPGPRSPILPEPKEADLAWARAHPGEWRYFVDPRVDKASATEVNVIGGWYADEKGAIEPWLNPAFTPSPGYDSYGIASHLELAIWRVDYGFCELGHFIDVFSRSDVIMELPDDDPEGQRGWPLEPFYTGEEILRIYTSAGHLPPTTNPWLRRTVSGRAILEEVCPRERTVVVMNGGSAPGLELQGSWLTRWWREWQDAERARRAEGPNSDG